MMIFGWCERRRIACLPVHSTPWASSRTGRLCAPGVKALLIFALTYVCFPVFSVFWWRRFGANGLAFHPFMAVPAGPRMSRISRKVCYF